MHEYALVSCRNKTIMTAFLVPAGKAQEALRKLHVGLRKWPKNGYLALLAANLEAKQGHTDNARRMYAIAAAHARSTIAAQVIQMIVVYLQQQ